jgi:ParB-like chromosome segregation protein Spo0J
MSQEIKVVECNKIIAAKSSKKGLNNNVLDQLHDSICKEGMLQPMGVRPAADKPGHYRIVYGEHRYYVVAKMMKEEAIECRVFADMSDEEAELAGMSENVCRTHAKTHDRLISLRKWQEVYQKHFPALVGKRAGATSRWANSTKAEAKRKAIEQEKAQEVAEAAAESAEVFNRHNGGYTTDATVEVEVEVASEPEPETKPAAQQTFRERVEAVTGVGGRTLDRDLKIARGFNDEQLYALGVVECTKNGMLSIIDATDDEKKRGKIVSLVASGMEVEVAIKDVLGVTTTKDAAGRVTTVGDDGTSPKAESSDQPPLSDDEWFERECGEFAGFLVETDQYKSDAILYRRIADERTKFRKSIKKIVAEYREERKGKKLGWFYFQLYRILNISHPKDWNICFECAGKSLVDPGVKCPKCKGACYETKTERY